MAKKFNGIRLEQYTESHVPVKFEADEKEHGVKVSGGDFPKLEIPALIAWLQSIAKEEGER